MRIKHARTTRKILTYFRAAHGFKPPFAVLLDGTAIQSALNQGISPDDALPKLLSERVRLLVPKQAVKELHTLGRDFSAAAKFARRQKVVAPSGNAVQPVESDNGAPAAASVSAADALVSLVASGNPGHYFVWTEDAGVRRRLASLPGVPLLRFARGRLVLEGGRPKPPAEEETPEVGKSAVGSSSANVIPRAIIGDENGAPKRKRPREKQPNPLSCKKKKTKVGGGGTPGSGANGANASGEEHGKRKRKRRRRAHGGADAEQEA